MAYLYKFKGSAQYNIDALLNNQLWISSLNKMNDPMDMGFYIDEEKVKNEKYSDEDIIRFQKEFNTGVYLMSFSTIVANMRLWNYYTDGFSGFVIGYKKTEIQKALDDLKCNYYSQKITYEDKTYDHTSMFIPFLHHESYSENLIIDSLFTKSLFWEEESEYRFSVSPKVDWINSEEEGGLIPNLRPSIIYVGYRMDEKNKKRIFEFCKKEGIELRMYLPNFYSRKIDYKVKTIYSPKLDV